MSECYKKNRTRVFEIYGLDPNDRTYNCHHIFSRSDRKLGLIPAGYDINAKENLYPMKIRDHINLHKLINKIDLECDEILRIKNEEKNRIDFVDTIYITTPEIPIFREVAMAV